MLSPDRSPASPADGAQEQRNTFMAMWTTQRMTKIDLYISAKYLNETELNTYKNIFYETQEPSNHGFLN